MIASSSMPHSCAGLVTAAAIFAFVGGVLAGTDGLAMWARQIVTRLASKDRSRDAQQLARQRMRKP